LVEHDQARARIGNWAGFKGGVLPLVFDDHSPASGAENAMVIAADWASDRDTISVQLQRARR